MCNHVSFHIAKAEWRKLFYSPIAWLLLIVFVIQAGMSLTSWFGMVCRGTDYVWENSLSSSVYWYFFAQMQAYVYLYVPLLTMGLMSEELSSGTISLMYSSPISNRQIVWGKYLAMVAYGVLLCIVLVVDVLLGIWGIQDFQWEMALVGVLGVFLLFCTYASIGLFMSSLISYQLIAAVGTFAIFAFLNLVGPLGINYMFLRDISYWLAINGRASDFSNGLITTEGLIYFISISALFIILTIIRLNAVRQKVPFIRTAAKNIGVIVITCLIGYFSAQPGLVGYWDTTHRKLNTLHPTCQEIVKTIPEDVKITLFANVANSGGEYLVPSQLMNDKHGTFSRFLRFKPNIDFDYVGFYDNVVGSPRPPEDRKTMWENIKKYTPWVDTSRILSPEQVKEIADLKPEENRSVRRFQLPNGRYSWLRFYLGMMPGSIEQEIGIAFKRLIEPSPMIGYALESRSYNTMKNGYNYILGEREHYHSMINMGFDLEMVELDRPIPENVSILILADLREMLCEEKESYLQQYINRGGNLIMLGEPRKREVMNPLFRKFGFEMGAGILVRSVQKNSEKSVSDELVTHFTSQAKELTFFFDENSGQKMNPMAQVSGCAPLFQVGKTDFQIIPVLQTDSVGVWNELQHAYITEEYQVEFNPEMGEKEDTYLTAVALQREINGKKQKILLSGDADILSNLVKNWSWPVMYNRSFVDAISHWMSDGQYPLDMRMPPLTDNIFYYTPGEVKGIKVVLAYIFPILLALAFGVLWFRRRAR